MLDIENTIAEMKSTFDKLLSMLDTNKEKIKEFEGIDPYELAKLKCKD